MTPTPQASHIVELVTPPAIWMPTPLKAGIPDCYQGSALEMVQQMAESMKPGMGTHDAIDLLLRFLADERGLHIAFDVPDDTPEDTRATMFVRTLLFIGVAEEMPQA